MDFGRTFDAFAEIVYTFTFGEDPLDRGEEIEYRGEFGGAFGFISNGVTPQYARIQRFDCPRFREVCTSWLDGSNSGLIIARPQHGGWATSVTIISLTVTVAPRQVPGCEGVPATFYQEVDGSWVIPPGGSISTTSRGFTFRGTGGADVIVGTAGSDLILPGNGNDIVCAGPGDDVLELGLGDDRAYGEDGADRMSGGPGTDRLDGGVGPDFLVGNEGADELFGGPGIDWLFGRLPSLVADAGDFADGGAAVDRCVAARTRNCEN